MMQRTDLVRRFERSMKVGSFLRKFLGRFGMKRLPLMLTALMVAFIVSYVLGLGEVYSAPAKKTPKNPGATQKRETPKAMEQVSTEGCTAVIRSGKASDIQRALSDAQNNGKDDVVCIEGTYQVTQTLTYHLTEGSTECGKKLTIRAVGSGVILDGKNSVQIMSLDTSDCGANAEAGEITVEGIDFRNGHASNDYGGGLFVDTFKDSITLTNNKFNGNKAKEDGGGAHVSSTYGTIKLTGNKFVKNSAYNGGAVFIDFDEGTAILKDNVFSSNTTYAPYKDETEGDGGAVFLACGSGDITFTNNKFDGNKASGAGGVYIDSYSGSVTLTNNTFNNNKGGAAYIGSESGAVRLLNNVFSSNSFGFISLFTIPGGVRIEVNSGSVILANNVFSKNDSGGADIDLNSGSLILVNNLFSRNAAEVGAGASIKLSSGSAFIVNNTFSGNMAIAPGRATTGTAGGVYVLLVKDDASLNVYNNIFWNNVNLLWGGIVYEGDGDDLYVENDGDENGVASPVNIAHNIFSVKKDSSVNFSTAPQTREVYIKVPQNYNRDLIHGCMDYGNYGNIRANPMFFDVQKENFRLKPNSPAIDKGCVEVLKLLQIQTDKDGNPRVVGGSVDIGAYEYQGRR